MRSNCLHFALTVFGACISFPCHADAPDDGLVAHWPLTNDVRDLGPLELRTTNYGVTFGAANNDSPASARFDGRNYLEAKTAPLRNLGKSDFSIALRISTDDLVGDEAGDLVTWYDNNRRHGFHLALRTNTGVTSCQANRRQLQFGIDAGSEPEWRDEGPPGKAILAFALAVQGGHLYAGTCEPGDDQSGHVYRYETEGKWVDLGSPDKCNAISAMAEYQGRLYVGSAKYRLAGSALPESENPHDGGKIFRLEQDGQFTQVGGLSAEQQAIGGMVVYRGKLYASSLYRPAGFYRYERNGEWTSLPTPDGLRVESLGVFNGYLWATSYDGGYVFRFDGDNWKSYGTLADNTQTYSFAIHRGQLCVGTWPSGRVYRLNKDDAWEDLGQLGDEREVMGMCVHNGQLYAGTLPLAKVFRYEDQQRWSLMGRLDLTPDVTYRRAWTMAQYAGRLFVSTLPSGNVHSMEVGKCVTYDKALPGGWRHITAIRAKGRLRLYVDGSQVAESTPMSRPFDFVPHTDLTIGIGPGDLFRGQMRDVRIYSRALEENEIQQLAQQK